MHLKTGGKERGKEKTRISPLVTVQIIGGSVKMQVKTEKLNSKWLNRKKENKGIRKINRYKDNN